MAEEKKETKEKVEEKVEKNTKPVENKQEEKQLKEETPQKEKKVEKDSSQEGEKSEKAVKEVAPKKEVPTKKFEPVKKEATKKIEKKNTSKGNRIILAIVVILIVAIIVGIIWMTSNTPRKAVESMFYAIKSGDFDKANQYVEITNLTQVPGVNEEDGKEDLEKMYYQSLKWKIGKITKENESAQVEVEVTNKNFKTVYTNYFQKMLTLAFSGKSMNDQETKEYLKEQIEKAENATTKQTILLTKQEGKWKVIDNDSLRNAFYPGMEEAINSISNVFKNQN